MNISQTNCMKTAISIPDDLFKKVEQLAKENKTSRSQIFCKAIELYLEKISAQKLLEALNSVYAEEESCEEKSVRKKSKEYFVGKIMNDKNDDQTG